jgi:hypothetical protein
MFVCKFKKSGRYIGMAKNGSYIKVGRKLAEECTTKEDAESILNSATGGWEPRSWFYDEEVYIVEVP